MFRGIMPALTLIVFGAGVGIGFAWTRGLIPLTLAPANSGSLSIEMTEREPLPPPPDDSWSAPDSRTRVASLEPPRDDAIVFQQQSEPAVETTKTASLDYSPETPQYRTITANRNVESDAPERPASDRDRPRADGPRADGVVQSGLTDDASSATGRVRTRDRTAVRLDPEAGIEEATEPASRRRSNGVVRQSADEFDANSRDSDSSSRSPNELLAAAEEKLEAGETLAAHREFSKIYWNHKDFRPRLQATIDSTAKSIFFQSKPNYVEPYVVREGDRLEAIAKKYQLSWEYLAKLNRTDPRRVQVGQKLKVMKGPFGAVIDQRDFTLTVHLQGYYVKSYQIGIGKDDASPTGKLAVIGKQENPQYTDTRTGQVTEGGDPSNPLGSRWIDLGDSFGIHGTIDPKSIGKAESRGCFRLRDEDIIEVYNFLVKGSDVVIRR